MKKDTAKIRNFELWLLQSYQKYLQKLESKCHRASCVHAHPRERILLFLCFIVVGEGKLEESLSGNIDVSCTWARDDLKCEMCSGASCALSYLKYFGALNQGLLEMSL